MNTGNQIIGSTETCEPERQNLEPLFPDEEEGEMINTMDITRCIYAIRQIEKRIEQYKLQLEEAKYFYNQKVSQHQERIEYLKRNILSFLQQHGLKNIQTPTGTAYQKEVKLKVWPSDDYLLSWAGIHLPSALRITTEPDKRVIAQHIKDSGEAPNGYKEETETRLYLK